MHKKTNALSALHLLFQFCAKVISSGTLLLQPLSHLLQQIRRFHVHQILMEKRHLQIQTVTDCFTGHGKLETKCHYNTICPLRQEYKRDFSLKWKMLWVIFDSPQTNVFVQCLIRRSALQKEATLHEHQRKTESSADLFPTSKPNAKAHREHRTYKLQNMQVIHICKHTYYNKLN